jgi:hypothetical protein
MAYLNYKDVILEIQRTGKYAGKDAMALHILGRRASFTSTSVFNDIGEGVGVAGTADFPVLAGSETIQVLSSNNIADVAAGTGARKIKMLYINTSYAIVETADITLNGTTAVTVVASGCLAVLWFEVTEVGTGGAPAGNLTLRTSAPLTLSYIPAGSNRSMDAFFMVPDGYTAYATCWSGGSIQNSQDIRLRATVNSYDRTLSTVYHFQDNHNVASNDSFDDELPALKYPARCKIKVSTISSSTAAATRCDCHFTIILIAD